MKKSDKYISDDGVIEKGNVFIRYHVMVICYLISLVLIVLGALALLS